MRPRPGPPETLQSANCLRCSGVSVSNTWRSALARARDISDIAFAAVSVAVLVLRRTDPDRRRPFRTPLIWLTAPIAIAGCLYLFVSLSWETIRLFLIWASIGLVVYFAYSRNRSHVGRGHVEVHEEDPDAPPTSVPPIN